MSQGCSPFQPSLLLRLPVMFSYKCAQGKVSQRTGLLNRNFNLAPRKLRFLTPAPTKEHIPSSQGFPPTSCLTPATPNTHFLLEKAQELDSPPVIPVPGARGAVSDASSTRKGSGLGPHFLSAAIPPREKPSDMKTVLRMDQMQNIRDCSQPFPLVLQPDQSCLPSGSYLMSGSDAAAEMSLVSGTSVDSTPP